MFLKLLPIPEEALSFKAQILDSLLGFSLLFAEQTDEGATTPQQLNQCARFFSASSLMLLGDGMFSFCCFCANDLCFVFVFVFFVFLVVC